VTIPSNPLFLHRANGDGAILCASPAMRQAVARARQFAATDLSVLLVGETGTGKELFARAIHHWSGRRGPLVDVNCGALPRDMVEGILFGHRRGAFTGAVEDAPGLIEEAHGGTLFLDEVGSLPRDSQVKLLRVLDSGEVRRLRDSRTRRVAFRTIAAAQADVAARIATGDFRRDLFQRLAGLVIELAPLAQRAEDLTLLAAAFARRLGATLGEGVAAVLHRYTWPGNVRELQAAVTRAARLATGSVISAAALAEAIALGAPGPITIPVPLDGDEEERERLIAVYRAHGGNARLTASALGISRATFYRRARDLGVSLDAVREAIRTSVWS
jgi:DNA-binding NtrC family response regulator